MPFYKISRSDLIIDGNIIHDCIVNSQKLFDTGGQLDATHLGTYIVPFRIDGEKITIYTKQNSGEPLHVYFLPRLLKSIDETMLSELEIDSFEINLQNSDLTEKQLLWILTDKGNIQSIEWHKTEPEVVDILSLV